jgi:small-conductance mechanosensitive channel
VTVDSTGIAFALALCLGAAVAHALLRRAARRLPRWLAARRGIDAAGGSVPGEASIALGCFLMRLGVWLVVLRALARRFQVVRGAQVRLESLIGMSVTTPLFALGERSYSIADLLTLLVLLAIVWAGIGMLARGVRVHVARLAGTDRGVQEAVTVVVRYALSMLGTIVLLQAWGIDVSSLTIVASVLGVGVGFGMQNIANNFVSGFLLTLERPIKPGDFVQVGELTGTVERIGARSTEVRTLDRVSILVPNAHLLEKEVINWSHGDPTSRIAVPVSIEYGGDLRRARAALLEAARAHPEVLADPRPTVELRSFGESGIEMELLVWTREPRRQHQLRSDLNFAILDGLARHGVAIPFPQQDVHVHAPALERALGAWARRTFSAEELAAAHPADGSRRPFDALPDVVDDRPRIAWSDAELAALVERMRGPQGVAIQDRRHLLKTYPRTFIGSEAVAWLRRHANLTRCEALAVGRLLVERRVLHHVLDEHDFEDAAFFYRFYADEPSEQRRRGGEAFA